jgi:hypothetical protein
MPTILLFKLPFKVREGGKGRTIRALFNHSTRMLVLSCIVAAMQKGRFPEAALNWCEMLGSVSPE